MANQALPKEQEQKTGLIRWINVSGSFTLRGGRRIERQEEFLASLDDVPAAFRDTVRPANEAEFTKATAPLSIEPVLPVYKVMPDKLPGRFNVVDSRGKILNDKSLDAEAAKAMAERLMAD